MLMPWLRHQLLQVFAKYDVINFLLRTMMQSWRHPYVIVLSTLLPRCFIWWRHRYVIASSSLTLQLLKPMRLLIMFGCHNHNVHQDARNDKVLKWLPCHNSKKKKEKINFREKDETYLRGLLFADLRNGVGRIFPEICPRSFFTTIQRWWVMMTSLWLPPLCLR